MHKHIEKIISILSFALLMQGCATVVPSTEKVKALKSCCDSFSSMSFEPLPSREKRDKKIAETLPVFNFQTGNSHFLAFELPKSNTARPLRTESYLSSSYLPSASVFAPNFIFLNQEKKVNRIVDAPSMRQQNDFWKGGFYVAQVEVQPGDQYVVIYADVNRIGRSITFDNGSTGQVIMAGTTPIYIAGSGRNFRQIPFDTTGDLTIYLGSP